MAVKKKEKGLIKEKMKVKNNVCRKQTAVQSLTNPQTPFLCLYLVLTTVQIISTLSHIISVCAQSSVSQTQNPRN